MRNAVDVIAGATIAGSYNSPQVTFPIPIQIALGQPVLRRRQPLQIKGGAEIGPLCAVANHATIGPIAQQQANGVHQDRLAGSGFASDRRHPGGQVQFQRLDDGEITDAQMGQHGKKVGAVLR